MKPHESQGNAYLASQARRVLLSCIIGSFVASALIAIGCILLGSLSELAVKLFLTAALVGATSVCALSCCGYADQARNLTLAKLGVLAAVVAGAMVIYVVWVPRTGEFYGKLAALACIVAVSLAYSMALLAIRLPASHEWLRRATLVGLVMVACLVSLAIITEAANPFMARLVAALMVAVICGTLTAQVLGKLSLPTSAGAGSIDESGGEGEREETADEAQASAYRMAGIPTDASHTGGPGASAERGTSDGPSER